MRIHIVVQSNALLLEHRLLCNALLDLPGNLLVRLLLVNELLLVADPVFVGVLNEVGLLDDLLLDRGQLVL